MSKAGIGKLQNLSLTVQRRWNNVLADGTRQLIIEMFLGLRLSQQQQQESEQAQSSQVHPQEVLVLEVVGTSIQPAFVIQQHGVNSPDLTSAHEATDTPDSKPEGILSKLPSKKDVATAKKLAVKKTQAMKKTASKKVSHCRQVPHVAYLHNQ